LSAVDLILPATSNSLRACKVSASDAALNNLEEFTLPSASAFLAYAVYFLFSII